MADIHAPIDASKYEPREGLKSKLTIVEMVYFRAPGESAIGIESRYSRELATDEQPCERRLKATENWQALDTGWLKKVGTIVITNREATIGEILEVAYCDSPQDGWLILPGESMRALPKDVKRLMVRSHSKVIRFTAHFFPR